MELHDLRDLRTGEKYRATFVSLLSVGSTVRHYFRIQLLNTAEDNLENQTVTTCKAINGSLLHELKLWLKLKKNTMVMGKSKTYPKGTCSMNSE